MKLRIDYSNYEALKKGNTGGVSERDEKILKLIEKMITLGVTVELTSFPTGESKFLVLQNNALIMSASPKST